MLRTAGGQWEIPVASPVWVINSSPLKALKIPPLKSSFSTFFREHSFNLYIFANKKLFLINNAKLFRGRTLATGGVCFTFTVCCRPRGGAEAIL